MSETSLSLEFAEESDTAIDPKKVTDFSQAVLYSTDWTSETIINQITRHNIEMNPRFQRRDAWDLARKSRFIESLILGLPIPQIVLAEKKGERGRYIVLDGKQRLLSLLQFTGNAEGANNSFKLQGLEARNDLQKVDYDILTKDPNYQVELNSFLNHTLRTVVIRNWPNNEFLHTVFLRLNTGSVKLSPQELRQAVVPGPFSEYVDEAAANSSELQSLLSRKGPDPRMRDVELLVRFLAMHNYIEQYSGRMKAFIDESCEKLSSRWDNENELIKIQIGTFKEATKCLLEIFGADKIARKGDSRVFNRAIFDVLIFYAADTRARDAMLHEKDRVIAAYEMVLKDPKFAEAVESDTAGIPHTAARLEIWVNALKNITGFPVKPPQLVDGRISFAGA